MEFSICKTFSILGVIFHFVRNHPECLNFVTRSLHWVRPPLTHEDIIIRSMIVEFIVGFRVRVLET
jgi:hypothetical protein